MSAFGIAFPFQRSLLSSGSLLNAVGRKLLAGKMNRLGKLVESELQWFFIAVAISRRHVLHALRRNGLRGGRKLLGLVFKQGTRARAVR